MLILRKVDPCTHNVRDWCVYILECSDGSYYTGITNNLNKRILKHNNGSGAKYTRSRLPVRVVAHFAVSDKPAALKLEHLIKKKTRKQKALIIEGGIENV